MIEGLKLPITPPEVTKKFGLRQYASPPHKIFRDTGLGIYHYWTGVYNPTVMLTNTSHESVSIVNQTVTAKTILPAHRHSISVTLSHCTSKSWSQVGKALASLSQLQTLALLDCNTGDALFLELCNSRSLLRLRIGIVLPNAEHCNTSEKGARYISRMVRLEELALGR